jgi:hypothetical protein
MNHRLYVALAIVTILATSWYACGGSGSSSNSSPTSPSGSTLSATMFEGTIAGSGGQSGAFSVTIQTAVAASSIARIRAAGLTIKPESITQVSGTLNVAGGASVTLAGSYDSSTNTVSLSGGGFTLTGPIRGAVLSGTYTGPSSSGVFSSLNATQNSVTTYLGTLGGPGGVFNLQVSANGAVSGEFFTTNGASDNTLTGQLNGTTLSLTNAAGGSGTGTIQGNNINGTCPKSGNPGPPFTTTTVSVPNPPPAASGVGFSIALGGNSGTPFTASFQNETFATTTGAYDFVLSPGVYTISGHVLGVVGQLQGTNLPFISGGNLTIFFRPQPNCTGGSGCKGGVAPGIQSSISCAGVVGCNPPYPGNALCGLPSPSSPPCWPLGTGGIQTVFPCQVVYAGLNGTSSLDFQLQFTVLATTTSNAVCQ